MNAFLRNVMAIRDEEHERQLRSADFHQLPKSTAGWRAKRNPDGEGDGPTLWQMTLTDRTERVKKLRAEGLTFAAITQKELNARPTLRLTTVDSDDPVRSFSPRELDELRQRMRNIQSNSSGAARPRHRQSPARHPLGRR